MVFIFCFGTACRQHNQQRFFYIKCNDTVLPLKHNILTQKPMKLLKPFHFDSIPASKYLEISLESSIPGIQ